jgi:hypothetical protein
MITIADTARMRPMVLAWVIALASIGCTAKAPASSRKHATSTAPPHGTGDAPSTAPAPPHGASEYEGVPFRAIVSTLSPDGRYVLGWGFKERGPIDWQQYFDEGRQSFLSTDPEQVENYLIALQPPRIVALLNGNHFGDDAAYNREVIEAIWHEGYLLHVQHWSRHTDLVDLYYIDADGAISGPVPLAERIPAWIFPHLRKRGLPLGKPEDHALIHREFAFHAGGRLTFKTHGFLRKPHGGGDFFTTEVEVVLTAPGSDGRIGSRLGTMRLVQ